MPERKTVGPFCEVTLDEEKTYPNGKTLKFVAYGAYNAFGLIGSENNGIAILDVDDRLVVVDKIGVRHGINNRHPAQFNGMTDRQIMDALKSWSWPKLAEFVNTNPNARHELPTMPRAPYVPTALNEIPDVFFADDLTQDKPEFAKRSIEFLNNLATQLKMPEGSFDVRYNEAGPASSGEAALHADQVYVQVQESFSGNGAQILFRRCRGRDDYTGFQNNFITNEKLRGAKTEDVSRRINTALQLNIGEPGKG